MPEESVEGRVRKGNGEAQAQNQMQQHGYGEAWPELLKAQQQAYIINAVQALH